MKYGDNNFFVKITQCEALIKTLNQTEMKANEILTTAESIKEFFDRLDKPITETLPEESVPLRERLLQLLNQELKNIQETQDAFIQAEIPSPDSGGTPSPVSPFSFWKMWPLSPTSPKSPEPGNNSPTFKTTNGFG